MDKRVITVYLILISTLCFSQREVCTDKSKDSINFNKCAIPTIKNKVERDATIKNKVKRSAVQKNKVIYKKFIDTLSIIGVLDTIHKHK